MNRIFLALLLLLNTLPLFSQENEYNSKQNSHYWKNRKPYAGYWQQDVHYIIDASINEKTNVVTATELLV